MNNKVDETSVARAGAGTALPFEQQPRESGKAFAAFKTYLELGPERSLATVAVKVGKSRAVIANAIRLLKLSPAIQGFIREGRLSVGHAKVILGLTDDQQQRIAAERIIKEALNVRQTEGLVNKLLNRVGRTTKAGLPLPPATDAHVADLENRLRERLGTKVQLHYTQGKGSLEVSFFSDAELERLLQILGLQAD